MIHLINRSGSGWLCYIQYPGEDEYEAAVDIFYLSDQELAKIDKCKICTKFALTDNTGSAYNVITA